MKKWQFWVSVLLGLGSVGAVACLILLGTANQRLQVELQKQQEAISKGTFSQQIGSSLLRDMGALAGKNPNIRNILVMLHYRSDGPAGGGTPARGGAK